MVHVRPELKGRGGFLEGFQELINTTTLESYLESPKLVKQYKFIG